VGVHGSREGSAQALLVGMAIANQAVVLAEAVGSGGQAGCEQLAGSAKERVTAVEEELADAVVEIQRTGVQAAGHGIVVRIPTNTGSRTGVDEQPRDDG